MANLKRYGPVLSNSGFATMHKICNGGWVKFADIKEFLPTATQQANHEICPTCNGSGGGSDLKMGEPVITRCHRCHGTGKLS